MQDDDLHAECRSHHFGVPPHAGLVGPLRNSDSMGDEGSEDKGGNEVEESILSPWIAV